MEFPVACFTENFNWVGLDFPADELGISKIVSPENCEALCQLMPDCKYFSYSLKTQKCYIKHLGYNLQPKRNYISGPKNCPTTPAPKAAKTVTTTTKPKITGNLR